MIMQRVPAGAAAPDGIAVAASFEAARLPISNPVRLGAASAGRHRVPTPVPAGGNDGLAGGDPV